MECAFQYSGSAFIKQIQQLVNFLLLRVRPPGNGLMSQRASLLTVCWKTICKTAKITTTYGRKVGRTKLGLMFCGWMSFFNLETVPSLKYWLLARMCHRGLPHLKLKLEKSFILFSQPKNFSMTGDMRKVVVTRLAASSSRVMVPPVMRAWVRDQYLAWENSQAK